MSGVDDDGFIIDFAVAFLPDDVDPAEVKRAVQDALNPDEPHRCEVYDADDRYLARHPGTPNDHSDRLAEIIERLNRRARMMPARLDGLDLRGELARLCGLPFVRQHFQVPRWPPVKMTVAWSNTKTWTTGHSKLHDWHVHLGLYEGCPRHEAEALLAHELAHAILPQ